MPLIPLPLYSSQSGFRKRRFITLYIGWFITSPVFADADLLLQIKAKLSVATIIQGHFHQEKKLKFLSKPLISNGEFTFDQDHGLIWKTLNPLESLILMSEDRLLSSQGEQLIPPSFGRFFPALLGGDLAVLQADFNYSGAIDGEAWHLQLVPRDELLGKVIADIDLSGNRELRSVEIREVNGNLSRIHFDDISHPLKLNQEQAADFARLSP